MQSESITKINSVNRYHLLTQRWFVWTLIATALITFFEQKIQGLLKDTFPIFQGLHSLQKHEQFYPKSLSSFAQFSFAVLLKLQS